MALGATLGVDPPPDTAEDIAAALRDDPILLSTILGNGATETIDRELHEKLEGAQYPVYVVLTATPPGLDPLRADEELATLVHAELDEDGVYYVHTSQGIGHLAVYGDLDPSVPDEETLISLARSNASDQARDEVVDRWGADAELATAAQAGIVLDVAAQGSPIPDYTQAVLSEDEVEAYGATHWHTIGYHYVPEPPTISTSTVLSVALGVVVAVVAFRALRHLPLPSFLTVPRQPRATADPERLEEARHELEELEEELEHPRSRWVDTERLVVAQQCRGLAHGLVTAREPDDLDVVGALVLVRTAIDALRASADDGPYTCCFVNPLHGRARHRAEIPGGLSVPTCAPCRRDLDAGTSPQALMERRGELERPYYAGDSIWARTGYGALVDELWTALEESGRAQVGRGARR